MTIADRTIFTIAMAEPVRWWERLLPKKLVCKILGHHWSADVRQKEVMWTCRRCGLLHMQTESGGCITWGVDNEATYRS